MKILMVCLGNICRSPLAEGIMRQKIEEKKLNWKVDSAGTSAWHVGEKPDPRSISTAGLHGIDISAQRGRQIQAADLDYYDLILTMDSSNFQDVLGKTATSKQKDKLKLIMNFAEPGRNRNVPDPYWNDDGFENVYQMLNEACDAVIKAYSEIPQPKSS